MFRNVRLRLWTKHKEAPAARTSCQVAGSGIADEGSLVTKILKVADPSGFETLGS